MALRGGAQLVAHLRQKARLGDVGGFGAMARFVGDRLGLFELADQRVLFGARFQRIERGRMQPARQQREIPFGRQREQREHVIVERAGEREIDRDRRGYGRSGHQCRDRQVGRQHARHCDHQQHQEHHQRVRRHVGAGGMDQDRRPAQPVEQIQHDKPRAPFARRRLRRRLREESMATPDHHGMDAKHAAGPHRRRDRLHPEPEQQAGGDHQQHDDIGGRQAGLGVLPEQFAVERRTGSAGRR